LFAGSGSRCEVALKTGWEGFVAVAVFLTHFWTLWLITACVFTAVGYYRRWKRKRRRKNEKLQGI
jgi:predicted membrane protein